MTVGAAVSEFAVFLHNEIDTVVVNFLGAVGMLARTVGSQPVLRRRLQVTLSSDHRNARFSKQLDVVELYHVHGIVLVVLHPVHNLVRLEQAERHELTVRMLLLAGIRIPF